MIRVHGYVTMLFDLHDIRYVQLAGNLKQRCERIAKEVGLWKEESELEPSSSQ